MSEKFGENKSDNFARILKSSIAKLNTIVDYLEYVTCMDQRLFCRLSEPFVKTSVSRVITGRCRTIMFAETCMPGASLSKITVLS